VHAAARELPRDGGRRARSLPAPPRRRRGGRPGTGSPRRVRRPPARPSRPSTRPVRSADRRRRLLAGAAGLVLLALLVAALVEVISLIGRAAPAGPPLTALQQRIVDIAESQLGYRTDPPDSYCNRYSAYWGAGAQDCGPGLRDEEWCADFAAWVWHEAGVRFSYGTGPGEIDAASSSFVEWGELHGTWHPLGSGYVPRPGDLAIYGFDPATMSAAHVAIVTSDPPGARGPDVVNGDGDRTAFSIVETGTDQWKADLHRDGELLSGYVSPAPVLVGSASTGAPGLAGSAGR
jgi:hypothetical protein